MTRLRRFEKIEKERPERDAGASPTASLAGRFGEVGAVAEGPQVLDLATGQPYVRCAVCRGDSHATSRACGHCGAPLDTPEQRAFNEEFWLRRRQEDAEQRAAADRLVASREQADREAAQARRQLEWMDTELALRRAGRYRGRGDIVITFDPGARAVGLAIGRLLRRAALGLRALWRARGR